VTERLVRFISEKLLFFINDLAFLYSGEKLL